MIDLWLSTKYALLLKLTSAVLNGPSEDLMNFLFDASTHPDVISLQQIYGDEPLQIVFHLTRSWCFAVHKQRAEVLGNWPSL